MTLLQAHLICLGLVGADLLARAWRIQWLVRGLGHRISLWDSFVLNAFGDAACALTPLRLGGEPARLAGMLRSRVPAPAAFVAISLEVLAAWPVIIVAAGWLAVRLRWIDLSDKTKRKPSGHAVMMIGDEVFAPRKYEAQIELERQNRLPTPAPTPDGDKGIAFADEADASVEPARGDRFRGSIRLDV